MRGQPKLIKLTDRSGKLKSNIWYIQYQQGGRTKRVSTRYRIGLCDKEAQIALHSLALEQHHPSAHPAEDWFVKEILETYYVEHAQYLKTNEHSRYHQKRLVEHFGHFRVTQVTSAPVDKYVRECQKQGRSNGTTRRELAYLTAALNHAQRNGRILYVPKFKMPPAPQPRERVLSVDEIARLFDACTTPHVRNFVLLMLNTGQRPGTVEDLKWEQVDFETRIIHFERTGKAQTNKRVRPIPMNDVVYQLLLELNAISQTDYVLEFKGKHAGCVKRAFDKACDKAGLEKVSRYTLRHTFGTHLYNQGIDLKTISDFMGHASTQTTSKHYLKANMDLLRNTVNAVAITAQQQRNSSNKAGEKSSQIEG